MNTKGVCGDCRFCIADRRVSDYRRRQMWFCQKKSPFFSRNCRPGEGGRVLPEQPACSDFAVKDGTGELESKEII